MLRRPQGRKREPKREPKRGPGNRRARGAIAALVLATVGATGLVAFVKGAEERALAGEKVVDVLVVKSRIPAGTSADALKGKVRTEQVQVKIRAEGAVDDLASVTGQVAGVDLLPGEQVTTARFVDPDVFGRTKGRVEVPDNLLEVTISLEPQRAVGGVIRPGSRVAVVASFEPFDASSASPVDVDGIVVPAGGKTPNSTHMILQKVLVTNVQSARSFDFALGGGGDEEGDDQAATAPAPSENLLVTVALDAPSVERVVFAAEHGTVWLAFDPETAGEEGTRVQTRGTVYQ